MQPMVPVVGATGTPLMPTTHRRANRLIARGRALRRFDRGLFYIQLVDRTDGYTQPVAMGIDPGSKREAFVVQSRAHTLLNVQTEAVTWVSQAVARRRRARRYSELEQVAPVHTVPGYVTKTLRDAARLHKSGAKVSDRWDAHCVDAFVLANSAGGGAGQPTSTQMLYVVPLQFHRRQLHRFNRGKGGLPKPYGGTRSLGLKRGSWVTHPRYGLVFVGGTLNGRISLHSMETGKRLTQHARVEECRMLCTASWRIRSGLKPGSGLHSIADAPT